MTISILIVDDQALVRAGFRMILGAETDLRVVGEAQDGDEAIRLATSLNPDVVLMDIQMPKTDGLEATRRIVAEPGTHARVVILTTFERDDYVFEALRVGASGFLLKNAPPRSCSTPYESSPKATRCSPRQSLAESSSSTRQLPRLRRTSKTTSSG